MEKKFPRFSDIDFEKDGIQEETKKMMKDHTGKVYSKEREFYAKNDSLTVLSYSG